MEKTKKSQYAVDLPSMHSICEMNYVRLHRLFSDYEKTNSRNFALGEARVCIEVVERCRYTTILHIHQAGGPEKWLSGLQLEVRAYHDAGMVEVSSFQTDEVIAARYQYPNDKMYQEDEKHQQNLFLGEWLENCLVNGRSYVKVF